MYMCKYPSKEYFVREYIEKGRTREDIAKENNCHLFKIHNYKRTISSQASITEEGSTTISKESTSQAIGDGNGEALG